MCESGVKNVKLDSDEKRHTTVQSSRQDTYYYLSSGSSNEYRLTQVEHKSVPGINFSRRDRMQIRPLNDGPPKLTRFAVLLRVRNKAPEIVAQAIIEPIISIFGPPETLHSDQGPEFENIVIYQMQQILGYKKTRTASYRPQRTRTSH